MMDDFIQLKKDNIIRLGIKDANGKDTGEHLEFDLEDIELPLKYQEFIEKQKKLKNNFLNKLALIEKRPDIKGKKFLSKNEEDKNIAIRDFLNDEVEIYNIFLGENGVQKLLQGRRIGWNTFSEIDEIIDKQILPHLDLGMDTMMSYIKTKYTTATKSDVEVVK